MMITVNKIDESTFDVTVKADSPTTHRVTVTDDYYAKLTDRSVPKEELIKESFVFLLQRESNTMIFSQFDLPVIQTYFSNYEKEIKGKLKS